MPVGYCNLRWFKQPALQTPSQYFLTLGKHSPQRELVHGFRCQHEYGAGSWIFLGDAGHCPNDELSYHRRFANGNCTSQFANLQARCGRVQRIAAMSHPLAKHDNDTALHHYQFPRNPR
jgi:hypothetical protein